ncbi:hypothetical protein Taro_042740 [Colocasia esculenta]|uniref:Uncharacterized protein n=1 Tax=Colocasia esculenta TaxID=4460 RepID=A0A843WXA1_COLES|nr:hypothetical protein [Colocasia esculenta]
MVVPRGGRAVTRRAADPFSSFARVSYRAFRVTSVSLCDLSLDFDFFAVSAFFLSLDHLKILSL